MSDEIHCEIKYYSYAASKNIIKYCEMWIDVLEANDVDMIWFLSVKNPIFLSETADNSDKTNMNLI